MSTDVVMQGQNSSGQLILKYKQIQTRLQSSVHQHKKALLQAKSQLQFQRNRANQFQQKYKTAIRYQNEQKQLKNIMSELNEKLKSKQNQLLQILKSQQQKKRIISQLQSDLEEQQNVNQDFQERLKQIQQGAVSAILEKEGVIVELEEKLHQIELNQSTDNSNLNVTVLQLQQKYKQLEDRSQGMKIDFQVLIQQKQQQLRQLYERSQHQKQKLEERVTRLQQEILDYEKHIEHLNQERSQEENLEEKNYLIEEKLRKNQKRTAQMQNLLNDVKRQYEDSLAKFTAQEEQHRNFIEEIKSLKLKIKELSAEIKDRQRTNNELKIQHEKALNELNKRVASLQSDKKKASDTIQSKNIQIQRLRVQIQEKLAQLSDQKSRKAAASPQVKTADTRVSLAAQIKNVNTEQLPVSPIKSAKKQNQEYNRAIQKYKNKILDLQQNVHICQRQNSLFTKKLEEKTKQLQVLRQRLVSESGSASRSPQQQKLLRVMEDLNSHIKKVENSLMINKLKYAEDQSYWTSKQKNHKVQMQNLMKQFKKQKSQLLERIDRMKKTVAGKDKKMDYYQSGFK